MKTWSLAAEHAHEGLKD